MHVSSLEPLLHACIHKRNRSHIVDEINPKTNPCWITTYFGALSFQSEIVGLGFWRGCDGVHGQEGSFATQTNLIGQNRVDFSSSKLKRFLAILLSTFHCCRMLSQVRVALQWCRLQLPLVALLWFIFPLVVLSSPHFRPRLSQSCRSLRSRWSLRSRFPMVWLGGRPSFLFSSWN